MVESAPADVAATDDIAPGETFDAERWFKQLEAMDAKKE